MEDDLQAETSHLQHELGEIRSQIAGLEAALSESPDGGLGRGDPGIARRELNRVLLERLRVRAQSIEQAILRIAQGTHGVCVQCGEAIHPDRLAVLPDTRLCIRCARNRERG